MTNQTCSACKISQPVSNFNWKNKTRGVRANQCKECRKSTRKKWYDAHREEQIVLVTARRDRLRDEIRELLWNYLSDHPCVDCGESDPVVLEFDHISGDKQFNLSEATHGGFRIEKVLEEIDKCEVRCANCHRRMTAKRGGHYKYSRSLSVTNSTTRS